MTTRATTRPHRFRPDRSHPIRPRHSPTQATAAGACRLRLKDSRQVAYEVKVISANGTLLKIKIAADGSVVSADVDN